MKPDRTRALEAGCPRCNRSMALHPGVGDGWCRSCGTGFAYLRLSPRRERGAVPLPAAADGASCAKHARNAAVASCERCGAFACELCRVQTDGRTLCPPCFDRLAAAGELASSRTSIRNYGGQAFGYGALSLLFPFFGLLLAPLAIVTGIKGRKLERELDERLFGWRSWVGIIGGSISILLYGILLTAMLIKAVR